MWLYTQEHLIRNLLSLGAGLCRDIRMGHSTRGERSWRLSSCLLWVPRRELSSLYPKGCLASQGDKMKHLIPKLVKVKPLSPFGHEGFRFIFLWWFLVIIHTGNFCCYYIFLHSPVLFLYKDQSCHTSSPDVLMISVFGRNCCEVLCNQEITWAAVVLQSLTRGEALESPMNLTQVPDASHFFLCLLLLCSWQSSQTDYPTQA